MIHSKVPTHGIIPGFMGLIYKIKPLKSLAGCRAVRVAVRYGIAIALTVHASHNGAL